MKHPLRSMPMTGILLLVMIVSAIDSPALAEVDHWAIGQQWLSVRAGYANSAVHGSGSGGGGYGFGYSRFFKPVKLYKWTFFKGYSLGGYVHHEILGGFAQAREVEVPATLELVRHMRWNSAYHPYVGIGGGGFYRKTYRTGDDIRTIKPGFYVNAGANAPVSERHLIGLDVRFIKVEAANEPPNPVFGLGSVSGPAGNRRPEKGTHWSVKLNWALTY